MSENALANRLKSIRVGKGLTKYRLAKLSGVSQTYIYRIELGEIKNPRRDTLQALAKGLNITLAQLVGEAGPAETWDLVEQSLKAYIPVYAGVNDMHPVDYVVCTRAMMPPATLRGYRIEGLCLDPEIKTGDTLIVDTALTPKVDDIILVIIDGQPVLKQCKDGHSIQAIHGVVVEYVRKLRKT